MARPLQAHRPNARQLEALGRGLDALLAGADRASHLARDPVRFVHRYRDPADQEVAAVFASALAFGRVDLFGPVLDGLFHLADAQGGPRAWVATRPEVHELTYRWVRPADLSSLARRLGEVLEGQDSLGALFIRHNDPAHDDVAPGLEGLVGALRDVAPLNRSLAHLLPLPSGGSACKRWNLFLRWMVRPADGVDLGLWPTPARQLLIPLDTHVHRLAHMLGLTHRNDASLRTAREITAVLRALDPLDPVRYDFALAWLGIGGSCRERHDPGVCPGCPLVRACSCGRPA